MPPNDLGTCMIRIKPVCTVWAKQLHHRKPRGMGGSSDPHINDPVNLIPVCLSCHQWIESHRDEAREKGWLVPFSKDPADIYWEHA